MRLFHLITPDDWAAALGAGTYAPPSLDTEGFVHFSYADQVTGTANLRYRDVPELVVLEIDPSRVGAELRVEDSYGSGTEFPHVYGAVPTAAAVGVHPIVRTPTGDWLFTAPDGATAAASPDRPPTTGRPGR